ncbi:MAG: SufE family protein [Rhodospirillaceae bacterium]|nr:SufE family protein [Rhodospirillaceae bacterium]
MDAVAQAELDDLRETFGFLDDWEERYAYIIDLGKGLPEMDDALKTEATKVRGCTSQVWMVGRERTAENGCMCLDIVADSDAHIVRGLIRILIMLYSGRTKAEIMSTDAEGFFHGLGLDQHLSPSRRNGLFSMVERIRALAA